MTVSCKIWEMHFLKWRQLSGSQTEKKGADLIPAATGNFNLKLNEWKVAITQHHGNVTGKKAGNQWGLS